jgi:hypothetical protein
VNVYDSDTVEGLSMVGAEAMVRDAAKHRSPAASIASFNDGPGRTKEQVVDLLVFLERLHRGFPRAPFRPAPGALWRRPVRSTPAHPA